MTVGMGVSPYFVLYLEMMFLYKYSITMVQTSATTMIQEKADESMQGRVFGLMGAMYSGFLPVGWISVRFQICSRYSGLWLALVLPLLLRLFIYIKQ